tara:strand:+ start:572 stop:835 length:264 start_codon:yes stop_codon:yes gene_type:complete
MTRNTQSIRQSVYTKKQKPKYRGYKMQDDEVVSQQLLEIDSEAREELNKILTALNQASANADKQSFDKNYEILLSYLTYKLLNIKAN